VNMLKQSLVWTPQYLRIHFFVSLSAVVIVANILTSYLYVSCQSDVLNQQFTTAENGIFVGFGISAAFCTKNLHFYLKIAVFET